MHDESIQVEPDEPEPANTKNSDFGMNSQFGAETLYFVRFLQ